MVAVHSDVFGTDAGDGLQQELGEVAEGDGVFAGDAALSHEEIGLCEGAVDAGGGGEIGAERFEFGRFEHVVGGTLRAAVGFVL